MTTNYASIYTLDGGELCVGLQTANRCNEAIRAARSHAYELDQPVHLIDSDGQWLVYPDGECERYSIRRAIELAEVYP